MQRRNFIMLLGGAAAWPLTARSQPKSVIKRVGILMGLAETDAQAQARIIGFREGLKQLGWTESANIQLDYYWGANGNERGNELAAEVVRKKVDVILTNSPTGLAAVKQATRSIPIVFVQVADPVDDGFVADLAHPGGNITGFCNFRTCDEYEVAGTPQGDRAPDHAYWFHPTCGAPVMAPVQSHNSGSGTIFWIGRCSYRSTQRDRT